MIIMIILFILSALCLVLAIFGCTDCAYRNDLEVVSKAVGGIFGGIFLVASLICGIFCACNSMPSTIATKSYQYQEQIILYKNEKSILESYHILSEDHSDKLTSNITFEVISTSEYYNRVNNYNDKIFAFKLAIKEQQFSLNNKWVNWFVCPACMSISDETLNSLTYTIGK